MKEHKKEIVLNGDLMDVNCSAAAKCSLTCLILSEGNKLNEDQRAQLNPTCSTSFCKCCHLPAEGVLTVQCREKIPKEKKGWANDANSKSVNISEL